MKTLGIYLFIVQMLITLFYHGENVAENIRDISKEIVFAKDVRKPRSTRTLTSHQWSLHS